MKTLTTILIAVLLLTTLGQAAAQAQSAKAEPILTLSAIKCAGNQVSIHFILRNVSSGDIVSELVYKYGKIPPAKNDSIADTYYYVDTVASGYLDIEEAYVVVNNLKVHMSNPGAHKGDYVCGKSLVPSPGLPVKRPGTQVEIISTSNEIRIETVR